MNQKLIGMKDGVPQDHSHRNNTPYIDSYAGRLPGARCRAMIHDPFRQPRRVQMDFLPDDQI
jgi:hypothetical protein